MTSLRQLLNKDRDVIIWLFDGKCVKCGGDFNHVHEINPISHGRGSLVWKNRVTLCSACHRWAHDIGTKRSIPILQAKRREYLIRKFMLDEW
jgi:5-methylcytosine-specific restriction endonuclease McrA